MTYESIDVRKLTETEKDALILSLLPLASRLRRAEGADHRPHATHRKVTNSAQSTAPATALAPIHTAAARGRAASTAPRTMKSGNAEST